MMKKRKSPRKLFKIAIVLSLFILSSCAKEKVIECSEPVKGTPSKCESQSNGLPFPKDVLVKTIHVYTAANPECPYYPDAKGVCEIGGKGFDKDYILVLNGHNPITWDLEELVKNSKKKRWGDIKGILVTGYYCQELLNAPSDIPIKYVNYDNGTNEEYFSLNTGPEKVWPEDDLIHVPTKINEYIDSCVFSHTGNHVTYSQNMYQANNSGWTADGE